MRKYLLIAVLAGALAAFAFFKGIGIGTVKERALWLEKEVVEVSEASASIKRLNDEARAKESLNAVNLANISDKLNEAQNEIKTLKDDISKSYADIARLRFNTETLQASGSEASPVTASTRECNGETITELSGEVFRYVYEGFAACDTIVEQLTAAQAVIVEDRRVCND